jgi:hypothetical protein
MSEAARGEGAFLFTGDAIDPSTTIVLEADRVSENDSSESVRGEGVEGVCDDFMVLTGEPGADEL